MAAPPSSAIVLPTFNKAVRLPSIRDRVRLSSYPGTRERVKDRESGDGKRGNRGHHHKVHRRERKKQREAPGLLPLDFLPFGPLSPF